MYTIPPRASGLGAPSLILKKEGGGETFYNRAGRFDDSARHKNCKQDLRIEVCFITIKESLAPKIVKMHCW